jgi:hypothetical protein
LPFDFRFAAAGALLPDLIDKPLAWFLVRSLPDDHAVGHTLWLPLSLLAVGLALLPRAGGIALMLLGLGALTHLLVDPVNAHPRTLFWPLFGTTFPDVRGYLFVLPITIEITLICLGVLALRRSRPLRERISDFINKGAL